MSFIEVFEDEDRRFRRWRWRRRSANGKITETPGQSFTRRWSAVRSATKAHPDDEIRFV